MNRRERNVVSLLGEIQVARPYYHCRACHQGHVPLDRSWRLNGRALTPGAQELTALAGLLTSFAEAAEKTLRKMSGLRLSESTVERTTEDAGERLARLLAAKATLGPERVWPWQRDAAGRTCAYVGLDATGVRQQGPRGAPADGRMAYVGLIYNPQSAHDERRRPPHQVRYLSGFYELSELGSQLRRQAAQVGWDQAEQQIALTDGGVGLEDFIRVHFPRAVCILDFWHAKEHLVELAAAWFEGDEAKRDTWLKEQCHRLKHAGGRAVLKQLELLGQRGKGRSPQAREAHRQHTQYFRNHVHRMDYPHYLAQGWQIGSGPVESACKTVVANRLKGGGMRWGEAGADALCHLRALWLSEPGQWETYWQNHLLN